MTIEPDVGRIRPEIARISVVLPAPFRPMTPTASARRTSRDTSKSAWKVPYPARTAFSWSMLATRALRSGPGRGGDGLHRPRVGSEVDLDDARIGCHLGGQTLGDLLAVVQH